jgi:Periplasmic copper-binding protein (NosD)
MSPKMSRTLSILIGLGIGAMTASAWAAPCSSVISTCGCTLLDAGKNYTLNKDLATTGTCLRVAAGNIAIDLNHHTIKGNGTGSGITDLHSGCDAGPSHVLIANGTIQNFGDGICFDGISQVTVSNMTVKNNGLKGSGECFYQDGIDLLCGGSMVTDTVADHNDNNGILMLGEGNTVANSHADNNSIGMFFHTPNGNIINGEASFNSGAGFFLWGANFSVAGSTTNKNGNFQTLDAGIYVDCPSTLFDNQAKNNNGPNVNANGSGCVFLETPTN